MPILIFSLVAGAAALGGACSATTARVCRLPRLSGILLGALRPTDARSRPAASPSSGCVAGRAAEQRETRPARRSKLSHLMPCSSSSQDRGQGRTAGHRPRQGALHQEGHSCSASESC